PSARNLMALAEKRMRRIPGTEKMVTLKMSRCKFSTQRRVLRSDTRSCWTLDIGAHPTLFPQAGPNGSWPSWNAILERSGHEERDSEVMEGVARFGGSLPDHRRGVLPIVPSRGCRGPPSVRTDTSIHLHPPGRNPTDRDRNDLRYQQIRKK